MTVSSVRPRAYLKQACPFCLKLRIFLTEAALADDVDFIVFADGDETHQRLRAQMEAAGQQPTFPAIEFEPGKLTTGTDGLIERFAASSGAVPSSMPLLTYYSEGVLLHHLTLFKALQELKAAAQ